MTTKYTVPTASSPKQKKRLARSRQEAGTTAELDPDKAIGQHQQQPQPASDGPLTAMLTLKTYDPVSGVCIKYQTNKAAEVGRLIGGLGRLGRCMAALPEASEGAFTPVDKERDTKLSAPTAEKTTAAASGGGKKKKKGKR